MTDPSPGPVLALLALSPQYDAVAAELGESLGLPVLAESADPLSRVQFDALMLVGEEGLSLQRTGRDAPGPVTVDFGSSAMRHRRRSGHNELLGKAVGVGKKSPLQVLDATAGLGRDAFVLADLGCQVTLCEREPLLARMLDAGIRVARDRGDPWLLQVMDRMQLLPGDARTSGASAAMASDVIYLDPMFPRRDKSAAVKKEMALFQLLLDRPGAQPDADELLLWALSQDVARVVVKRPPRASCLAGRRPSHEIGGKAVRYDVYVLRKLG